MAWYDFLRGKKDEDVRLDESMKVFVGKGDIPMKSEVEATKGEGVEDYMLISGYGSLGYGNLNTFYNRYINKVFETEVAKIIEYRKMAEYPEIGDVIEDAVNESTLTDNNNRVFSLIITDNKLSENKNVIKNLYKEFDDLFYRRIEIDRIIDDLMRTYYIDGRVYYERIINTKAPSQGIQAIKKLPSETMDYVYDPMTGQILYYYQYLAPNTKRPINREEAEKDPKVVVFNPEQIGYINYGIYGRTKGEVYGYLEKARVPYNQLKLLETSVIIYRIIRAPERFVFKIDTGNMPKDKAMKFVEKIKTKFIKRQTYDPQTGQLSQEPEVLSILENFFLPQSADGRGSSIETVGGNPAGFSELDDIYYFARKLYRALKYPASRVTAGQEKREAEIVVGGSHTGEISRDEVKWAKFLEKHQKRFCDEFKDLFLMHLAFRGLKKQYGIEKDMLTINMVPPSHYKESLEQGFVEVRHSNYNALAGNQEFSKYFLMKKYLGWTDEEIEENIRCLKDKDKLFQPPPEPGMEGEMGSEELGGEKEFGAGETGAGSPAPEEGVPVEEIK
ncbi:MAG TPA: portal protein [Bacteroidales bacterium]|nr:portal protein [Bacteroidales bacterium]